MYAKRLDAGPERFTIACTCPSGQQSGSVVVPITITMNSGGPDDIDLTYSAVDGNGNPVSCAPAGSVRRFRGPESGGFSKSPCAIVRHSVGYASA
jgi:hypothetical protein